MTSPLPLEHAGTSLTLLEMHNHACALARVVEELPIELRTMIDPITGERSDLLAEATRLCTLTFAAIIRAHHSAPDSPLPVL